MFIIQSDGEHSEITKDFVTWQKVGKIQEGSRNDGYDAKEKGNQKETIR